MICGFLNGKIVNAEEYLINYSIRTGQLVHIPTDLLNMPITFDGNDINTFILDVVNNKLVIQLVLSLKEKFDDTSNVYKTSYIRNLLNSNEFLSRFNKEFIEHINLTTVHTRGYTIEDKLWLLSHEEINRQVSFFSTNNNSTNNNCFSFELFKNVDLEKYSQTLLYSNKQNCYSWWLRSANSDYFSLTGYVSNDGTIYNNFVFNYGYVFPVCIIG